MDEHGCFSALGTASLLEPEEVGYWNGVTAPSAHSLVQETNLAFDLRFHCCRGSLQGGAVNCFDCLTDSPARQRVDV